jgi:cytochrome c
MPAYAIATDRIKHRRAQPTREDMPMSRRVSSTIFLSAFMAAALALPLAAQAADLKDGKKVFRKCKACHQLDKPKNKVGPHLVGIIGRKAASVEDYKYSDAMQAKGAEGLIWTEETLAEYLAKPKDFVPKTKMVFPGLRKPEQIEDLIAYLKAEAGG